MAQTEVEKSNSPNFQPNHSLDKIGASTRRVFTGLCAASLLIASGVFLNEQVQSNVPQPAYEHAFVEGDEKEPKVGEIYYLRNDQQKAGGPEYFKVEIRNKVLATLGRKTKVVLVLVVRLDDFGKPILDSLEPAFLGDLLEK
jgi:hypothetical protein